MGFHQMHSRRTPWWLFAGVVPFAAYFALLVYCDLRVPESEGLAFAFGDSLVVRTVEPGSPGQRAGLIAGDVIVAVDGRPMSGRKMDWVAVANNVRFGEPLALEVRRSGEPLRAALTLGRAPTPRWETREGVELLLARLVQFVSIALGCLIVFRRPDDRVARLGGWLLASVGVFCVVLPFRIASVWRDLWWPLGAALWIPFASSLLIGALLLSFFLSFPVRRLRSPIAAALLWLPMAVGAAPFLRYQLTVVYAPTSLSSLSDGLPLLLGMSVAYLGASGLAAGWSYRHLTDKTERRRLRVLSAGTIAGSVAAAAIVVGWWLADTLTLFGSTAMAWLFPLLLMMPASFAYAILRHRLFDVRLIVRQGLRYALARRLLLSLVPALLLAMAVDLYAHRDRPLREVLAARASVYLLLSAAAIVAQGQRQRWLLALDRRFFRERYDAHRLLSRVVDDLREAPRIEDVAAAVVEQVELALHPRFAALLVRPAGAGVFRSVAAAPVGSGPDRVPADARVVQLARVLGRPLDVGSRASWVGEELRSAEAQELLESGLELLVPIPGSDASTEAFLALGARRSEEPYAREDTELLGTIAATLGLLLGRAPAGTATAAIFGECPSCGRCEDDPSGTCPADGERLVAVNLPRLLVARYRLDRRLARGGMGTVYEASDTALRRAVAVKVLRDDLAGDPEAARRFENEARTAAAFSHPHVVTIHDFGITDRGRGFLVMERLDGKTLRAEIDVCPHGLAPDRAQRLLRGICAAVDAAHRRQLVHRDLKPENVFLAQSEGGEVAKVLDFGIAKALGPLADAPRRQTRGGAVLGTPEYMAPEQLRGGEPSPTWDTWALGVLAFEMLTGRHPFALVITGSVPAVPAAYPALLQSRLAGFGPAWGRFFSRALAIDPAGRPPSAAAVCLEFDEVLRGQPAGDA